MFSRLKKRITPRKPSKPEGRVVDVDGRPLPLTIRQNERATRMTLRIEPGGRALRMTVPPGLKHWEVDDFLERHRGWLRTRLAKIGQPDLLGHGAMVPFRGIPHRIHHTGQLRGVTEAIMVDGEPVLSVSGAPEHLRRRLAAFFKKEARLDLEPLCRKHAARVGKPFRSLALKDTRSRWGSCSWEGNLSFSWRIVMAPPVVIDYLAAHEVAHLQEMNHGPKFWTLCQKLCPETEMAKAWLKRHGSALHAIDFG